VSHGLPRARAGGGQPLHQLCRLPLRPRSAPAPSAPCVEPRFRSARSSKRSERRRRVERASRWPRR